MAFAAGPDLSARPGHAAELQGRSPAPAEARSVDEPVDLSLGLTGAGVEPKVVSLKNGLTVLIQEDNRFPLASVRLYVRAGSAYEDKSEAGISHLLEHMVFKGTAKRAPGQVARDVEGVGGYLNAATSFDYTMYYVDVPAREWALGLDVIQDMIFGAKIDPAELAQERAVVLSELERGEDDPGQTLFKTVQRLIWPDTPYGRPIIGYPETLKAITPEDVHGYIRRFYQPRSMLLVVVGQVEPDKVLAEAEKTFGGLANDRPRSPLAPLSVGKTGQGPVVEVKRGNWNKAYMTVAFPIQGFHSEESAAWEVLSQLMGGDRTSKLYRTFVYQSRLVDDLSVSAMTLEGAGMLYISATLDPDKIETFWAELIKTLKTLKAEDFTDEEVARAKLNIEDSLFQVKETLSGVASKLGHFQFFEGSYRAEDNYIYSVAHVTKQEMQGLLDRYLAADRLYAALLVPESAAVQDSALAQLARSQWPQAEAKLAETRDLALAGQTERIDLGAGKTLVLIPDATLPYTAVSILWSGGDALVSPSEQGLPELASRVLNLGTKSMKATDFQDYLSDRASRVTATAGRETFSLVAKFPTRFSADVLPVLQEVMLDPAFAPEEVERARQDQIASIKSREDEPLGLAFMHIFPFLFEGSSYGYFHLGKPEAVAGYTPDQIRSFWSRQLDSPWVMAVCGLYDRQAVMAMAKAMAERTSPGRFTFQKPDWSRDHAKDLALAQRNQAHVMVSFPIPGMMESEDSAGLSLMRAILAGQGGLLFRELRDRQGLGYVVTAFAWQAPKAGFLSFYIGTDPSKIEQATQGFQEIIERLKASPLPEWELDRAKSLLQGDYFRDHQSLSSRSQEAASLMIKGLPMDYNRQLIDQAQKLTPADVQALAKKYLDWSGRYTLRVLP